MNNNKYVFIPLITLMVCQFIKFLIESIKCKKLMWGRLFNGSGGFPSSHTSFSVSITFLTGLDLGFNSIVFAVCLVFTLIIIYDSMGLRAQTGMQAVVINKLIDAVFEDKNYNHLKEELGHKPFEVLAGIIFGISSATVLNLLF